MRYRKLPVEIEAIQWLGKWEDCKPLYNFLEGGNAKEGDLMPPASGKNFYNNSDGDLIIKTLEGEMKASDGDYIIKGINGEFYPCKPDIFERTYEPISEEVKP